MASAEEVAAHRRQRARHESLEHELADREAHWSDRLARYCERVGASDEHLPRLQLRREQLGPRGASALAAALRRNHSLTSLQLADVAPTDGGAAALVDALDHNATLLELSLRGRGGDKGAPPGAPPPAGAPPHAEHTAHFAAADPGARSLAALARLLRTNTTLTTLQLWDCDFGGADPAAAAAAAERATAAEAAAARRGSALPPDSVAFALAPPMLEALSLSLRRNRSLTSLDLLGCGVGDAGAALLAGALRWHKSSNRTLRHLALWGRGNDIGPAGATALSEALVSNSTLTSLTLAGNARLGDAGATALAGALRWNGDARSAGQEQQGGGGGQQQQQQPEDSRGRHAGGGRRRAAPGGAEAVSAPNAGLRSLSLRGCGLTNEAAFAFAAALAGQDWEEGDGGGGGAGGAWPKKEAAAAAEAAAGQRLLGGGGGGGGGGQRAEGQQRNTGKGGGAAADSSPRVRLLELDLAYNEIECGGVLPLALSLQTAAAASLTSLSLAANYVGGEGAAALCRSMWLNTSLRRLDLERNDVDEEHAALMTAALERNELTARVARGGGSGGAGAAAAAKRQLAEAQALTRAGMTTALFREVGQEGGHQVRGMAAATAGDGGAKTAGKFRLAFKRTSVSQMAEQVGGASDSSGGGGSGGAS